MAACIAFLRKDTASDYGVDFPDPPGCVTAGRTLEEARRAAAEALHLDGLAADGEAVPSELDAVMNDPHDADAVALVADAPMVAPRSVRVSVVPPEDVLQPIEGERQPQPVPGRCDVGEAQGRRDAVDRHHQLPGGDAGAGGRGRRSRRRRPVRPCADRCRADNPHDGAGRAAGADPARSSRRAIQNEEGGSRGARAFFVCLGSLQML